MRASQIMFRRAGYVMNPDPKIHGQILRSIRNYQTRKLPCFDQLTHIEARLRGLSAKECKSQAEKRLEKKREEEKRRHEAFERDRAVREEEDRRRREAEDRKVLTPMERRKAEAMFDAAHARLKAGFAVAAQQETEVQKARAKGLPVVDGVVQGPWGEAS